MENVSFSIFEESTILTEAVGFAVVGEEVVAIVGALVGLLVGAVVGGLVGGTVGFGVGDLVG